MSAGSDALKSLSGPAHFLGSDPVHRAVLFEPNGPYASLVRFSTPGPTERSFGYGNGPGLGSACG